MEKKYEFTEDTRIYNGRLLHRIVAIRDFSNIQAGQKGGWIEKEDNLSHARVADRVIIDGKAHICGNAVIKEDEDFIVFKNWWSSGRYFTWTRSNDKYKVGCFYGTGKELIEAAYNDSEEKGREYERIVNYVNSIKNDGK